MSELQHLIESLQETDAAISETERVAAENPTDELLRLNAQSIAQRRDVLLRRINSDLTANQAEIVRYRVMRDWSTAYPAKAVAASLIAFQDLVTAVFDALRTAPKLRYRPSAENVELSTFDFAGAFAGSVIVSLSVPDDRLLVGETDLEQTFALVERALSARESDDLKLLADKIGVAAISKAYTWADTSVSYGLNTEIRWGKALDDTREVTISRAEAETVRQLISDRSDTTSEPLELEGTLLGFDGDTSYFHFRTFGDEADIRGNLAPGLPTAWTTSQPYRARVLRTVQIKYATGEEIIGWTLLSLEPLEPPPLLTEHSA